MKAKDTTRNKTKEVEYQTLTWTASGITTSRKIFIERTTETIVTRRYLFDGTWDDFKPYLNQAAVRTTVGVFTLEQGAINAYDYKYIASEERRSYEIEEIAPERYEVHQTLITTTAIVGAVHA